MCMGKVQASDAISGSSLVSAARREEQGSVALSLDSGDGNCWSHASAHEAPWVLCFCHLPLVIRTLTRIDPPKPSNGFSESGAPGHYDLRQWKVCLFSDFKSPVLVIVLVTQACLTLPDPMDCSLPGSSVCGILQARILRSVATSFSRGSSQPRDQTPVFCIAGRFFTIWATREVHQIIYIST